MIVLDEQVADPRIIQAIEDWYPGKVISISEARPRSQVLDQEIPALLRHLRQPTFVTINYSDFWAKIPAQRAYCVICIKLPVERSLEVPNILRGVLKRSEFRTKRGRMGRVISVRGPSVSYYRHPKVQ